MVGLAAVSTANSIVIPILVAMLITRHQHYRWQYVALSFGVLAVTATYGISKTVWARRHGRVSLSPTDAFAITCGGIAAIVCGHLAAWEWSAHVFVAMLVLPMLFFGLVGDGRMILAGWLVTLAAIAVELYVQHPPTNVFLAGLELWGSVDLIAALMVAFLIRHMRRYFRSSDTLQDLTKRLAGATAIEVALADCLPLVHTVIPCTSATVYAYDPGVEPALSAIVGWAAPGSGPLPIAAADVRAVDLASGAVIDGSRCFVPVGYAGAGELLLILDGIGAKQAARPFVQEAADTLCSSLLLMCARLTHIAALERETRTDALTGLANRRALQERLEVVTAQAQRTGSPVTVAMIDLDHFKQFNDRFGHQNGDELLRRLSAALVHRLRATDLLARYGGEEFCVVLPDTGLVTALALLEDMRELTATVRDGDAGTTISVGVAEWTAGDTTDALLRRADQALYSAKDRGRNRVIAAAADRSAA